MLKEEKNTSHWALREHFIMRNDRINWIFD